MEAEDVIYALTLNLFLDKNLIIAAIQLFASHDAHLPQ